MIVGTKELNFDELKLFVTDDASLITYVENLIPQWAKCFPHIVDNQRYYVAIHIRDVLTLPYKVRKKATEALVKNVQLHGVMNNFVDLKEIMSSCDTKALGAMLLEDYQHSGGICYEKE